MRITASPMDYITVSNSCRELSLITTKLHLRCTGLASSPSAGACGSETATDRRHQRDGSVRGRRLNTKSTDFAISLDGVGIKWYNVNTNAPKRTFSTAEISADNTIMGARNVRRRAPAPT
ncbi:hypothetical protein EVAR_32422_1 [Eumeta japonica]|uniref:Uncharacterized protein n=1 Tax=Eumeta variegata TaxID=151549 RepID=A0A4C1VLS8_EUMVA|nr:hypothetical protein EVAR_32422_1 [Eumeta japonica]